MSPAAETGADEQVEANERATVGALVLSSDSIRATILASLADEDITDTRARFLLTVVRTMVDSGVPVDPITVAGFVTTHALLGPGAPRLGIGTYLHSVTSAAPVPISGPWYAALTVEASARRRITEAGAELIRVADAGALPELRSIVTGEFVAVASALQRAEQAVSQYAA